VKQKEQVGRLVWCPGPQEEWDMGMGYVSSAEQKVTQIHATHSWPGTDGPGKLHLPSAVLPV
jgi:hypothetical protein